MNTKSIILKYIKEENSKDLEEIQDIKFKEQIIK